MSDDQAPDDIWLTRKIKKCIFQKSVIQTIIPSWETTCGITVSNEVIGKLATYLMIRHCGNEIEMRYENG